jgi:hypothetical protein
MPGHDTSSFVSRDRGLAEVIDGRIFAPQSGFGRCQPLPDIMRTEARSLRKNHTSAETYGEPQTPAEPP